MSARTKARHRRYAEHVRKLAADLVEQLQRGTAPWQQPWRAGPPSHPHNVKTKRPYSALNALSLTMEARLRGFQDPRWGTYRQIQAMGGQVRKGERSVRVLAVFDAGPRGKPDDREDAPDLPSRKRGYRAVKVYPLFNAEQADGLPQLERPKARTWRADREVERILQQSRVRIVHDRSGKGAHYDDLTDTITLPSKELFDSALDYYQTALHELAHATGHRARLDRPFLHDYHQNRESRAREELRADMCAMLTGIRLGAGFSPQSGGAYVAHWVKALNDDPMEIRRAATEAHMMSVYIIDEMGREIGADGPDPPPRDNPGGVAGLARWDAEEGLGR